MKYTHIYIVMAWEKNNTTHPLIITYTNRKIAINVAKQFKKDNYYEVKLRRDTFVKSKEIPYIFYESFINIQN